MSGITDLVHLVSVYHDESDVFSYANLLNSIKIRVLLSLEQSRDFWKLVE